MDCYGSGGRRRSGDGLRIVLRFTARMKRLEAIERRDMGDGRRRDGLDENALDLVQADLVVAAVVELGRAG
jgi:hypothetical protein